MGAGQEIIGAVDETFLERMVLILLDLTTGQTPPTHPLRQWSLKPTGCFRGKLLLAHPPFRRYDMAMYYRM
jgi:hypothetical protein